MDIAISGASGLIGSALASGLTESGHRVLRLVRRSPATTDEAHWDPTTGDIDAASLEGAGAVVHLAGAGVGERRWTNKRKATILQSRTSGTEVLATAISRLARPPATFLSGSAIGYYGDTGDAATDESAPPSNDFLARVCVAWEAAARPVLETDVRVVFLRTGIVLSPAGGALARQLPFFRFCLGGRIGSGRQWQSWISIDDEVRAIEHLLDSDVSGPVNLTAPHPVTNAEFTKTLGRVLRRPTTITPKFALKLVYGSELTEALVGTSQRVLPQVLEQSGFDFLHDELEPALRAVLGLPFPPSN